MVSAILKRRSPSNVRIHVKNLSVPVSLVLVRSRVCISPPRTHPRPRPRTFFGRAHSSSLSEQPPVHPISSASLVAPCLALLHHDLVGDLQLKNQAPGARRRGRAAPLCPSCRRRAMHLGPARRGAALSAAEVAESVLRVQLLRGPAFPRLRWPNRGCTLLRLALLVSVVADRREERRENAADDAADDTTHVVRATAGGGGR